MSSPRFEESCGPQPSGAEARKHPAVAGRAPQAAPRKPSLVILRQSRRIYITSKKQILRRYAPQNDVRLRAGGYNIASCRCFVARLALKAQPPQPARARTQETGSCNLTTSVMLNEVKHPFSRFDKIRFFALLRMTNSKLISLRGLDFGCASVMSEQVRHNSRLAPSSLPLGKACKQSLHSLNREVVNCAF